MSDVTLCTTASTRLGGLRLDTIAKGCLLALLHCDPTTITPQALVSVLWAFAALGAPPEAALLDAAVAQLRGGLGGLRPGDLATTVWALATMRHHPGDALLDAAVADAHQRLAMFSPQVHICVAAGIGFTAWCHMIPMREECAACQRKGSVHLVLHTRGDGHNVMQGTG